MIYKIISYNINGVRAAEKKGLSTWIQSVNPDMVCFQEIKALESDIPKSISELEGYHKYWYPAQKKGYSGVGILSKVKPNHVEYGCGIEKYDFEGRILRLDFDKFSLISLYLPSGSSGELRQDFKEIFLDDLFEYIQDLRTRIPNLIISGDYNICHKAIDIHDPVRNKKSSGFLPQEREWMTRFIESGFVDTFRTFNEDPHHYTWWSYRAGARANNKGWRIDYHLCSDTLKENCKEHVIFSDAVHSDHCPLMLSIEI